VLPRRAQARDLGAPPAEHAQGFSGFHASLALQPHALSVARGRPLFALDDRTARLVDEALARHPGATWEAPETSLQLRDFGLPSRLVELDAGRRGALYTGRRYGWLASLPPDSLAAGIEMPRVERDKNGLQQAIARGVLGFLVGRAVSELSGQKPQRVVSVRSATDPHGHGVGLGVSASW
jgi:hypothetical protein